MSGNAERQRIQHIKRIPCEVYSRIVGYLRPVQAWNEGKQQEFLERETYDMERCLSGKEHTPAA
jgi:anaerobic ribonucleoside-triphosphate reductase